jgi:hypothetical protein
LMLTGTRGSDKCFRHSLLLDLDLTVKASRG